MNYSGYIMSGNNAVARVVDNNIEPIIKEKMPLYLANGGSFLEWLISKAIDRNRPNSRTNGAYVNPDRSMYPVADIRQVAMCFDSQWCDTIEMVFEGVTSFILRPAGDNYTADISAASL